jgi:hypothetical protein
VVYWLEKQIINYIHGFALGIAKVELSISCSVRCFGSFFSLAKKMLTRVYSVNHRWASIYAWGKKLAETPKYFRTPWRRWVIFSRNTPNILRSLGSLPHNQYFAEPPKIFAPFGRISSFLAEPMYA